MHQEATSNFCTCIATSVLVHIIFLLCWVFQASKASSSATQRLNLTDPQETDFLQGFAASFGQSAEEMWGGEEFLFFCPPYYCFSYLIYSPRSSLRLSVDYKI